MGTFNRYGLGKVPDWSRGFTLGELIFAIFIGASLLLLAIPEFKAFSNMAVCKKGTREITSAIRLARSLAISTAYEHRVEIDPKHMRYRMTRGNQYAKSADSSWGRNIVFKWRYLPGNLSLRVNTGCRQSENMVYFHANPNGSTNSRYVCILDENGANQFRVGISYAATGRVRVQKWNKTNNSWK